jgi:hypothetical protein
MKKNLGQVDRVARVFIGAVILIVAAQFGSWWGLLGLALIITGAVGYCGLYDLVGIKTCCKTEVPGQAKAGDKTQPPAAPQQ